jgi:hypothetical protein
MVCVLLNKIYRLIIKVVLFSVVLFAGISINACTTCPETKVMNPQKSDLTALDAKANKQAQLTNLNDGFGPSYSM